MASKEQTDPVEAALGALITKDEVPACLLEAYQVMMVMGLLFDNFAIGEASSCVAYGLGRVFTKFGSDVKPLGENIAKYYEQFTRVLEKAQKNIVDGLKRAAENQVPKPETED